MLAVLLALSAPATHAAEIEVAISVPINVLVDGVPVQGDEGSGLGVARDLAAGHHVLETRNMMGKTTAYKELDLAADDRVRFEYRQKELWHIGTYKIAGAAPVETTTVVQTTTTAAPVTGMGVTVSDGVDTVHVGVGAGLYGGGVVVSDGQSTVSMNAGISVTETTTTTTTTVVSSGSPAVVVAAPAPAEVAPVAMDERAFGAFLRQLDNASFSDDKLSLIETTAANNWMTCDQLARILDTLDHGSDKVKAVGIVRNSIVDPQNAFVLNDRFSFSSDAQKAQAYFR